MSLAGLPGEDLNAGGDLDVAGSFTIRGLGPRATVLDGGGLDRVLHVLAGATVTVEDLAIRRGLALGGNGGGILVEGTLTLARVAVTRSVAEDDGGGIAVEPAGFLTATDVDVADNEADNNGGGLHAEGALALTRVRLLGNRANRGGGLFVGGSPTPVTIADSTIAGNVGSGGGGGVAFRAGATGIITRSTVSGNWTTNGGGGGVQVDGVGTALTVSNSTIAYNLATSDEGGGGLSLDDGVLTLVHTTVTRNVDAEGSATGGDHERHRHPDPRQHDRGRQQRPGRLRRRGSDRRGPRQHEQRRRRGSPAGTPFRTTAGPPTPCGPSPAVRPSTPATTPRPPPAGSPPTSAVSPGPLDGDGNGSAVVDIGAVEVEPDPGGLLALSPPTGVCPAGHPFRVALLLHAPGRTLAPAGTVATLDGAEVSTVLAACLIPGPVPPGGLLLACPALTGRQGALRAGLSPGTHTLAVTLAFTDGSTARATAVWEVLDAAATGPLQP